MAMLRQMHRRWVVAALVWLAAATVAGAPAGAASPTPAATADLIPGPPTGSWTPDTTNGPMTVHDFYGGSTTSAPGFVDAYAKGWDSPQVGLSDNLLHYSSVFWAAYAVGIFKGGAQRDVDATSVHNITGFGTGAFEVTYAADSQGYIDDWIYFTRGDYMAAIAVSEIGNAGHTALVDQATRQLSLLPFPTAEYQSFGYGFLVAMLAGGVIVGGMAVSLIVIAVIVARRRPPTAVAGMHTFPGVTGVAPGGLQLSADGRHWWDGYAWQDTEVRIPPSAKISPDGTLWWDGMTWRRMPSAGGDKV
jgi:hypothetical protein